ncbi:MAG: COX15/CtaA family protein [Candidatus Omnitrophica bacterium]|nr:COX15/CtaA family protein [Candidatus Omnitrophota bacterium]
MNNAKSNRGQLLTLGFGTTTIMWTAGYACHIPPAIVPSPIVLILLLLCLLGGGYAAGRFTAKGWKAGLQSGLITGALNLLILGSLLTGDQPNQITPSALYWIPGSIIVCAMLGAIGAALGSLSARPVDIHWTAAFAWTAAAATFILLIIGGIVTGQEAGLAVVDWPNSFGYNMFLYPLSRMTGGIYFEHAHRLFGSLVGLTTLTLAVHLFFADSRTLLRMLGIVALILVIAQGIMGGLRVTGHFTWSDIPSDTAPNLILAVIHGVVGQVFLALLASIAVIASPSWSDSNNFLRSSSAATEKVLSIILVMSVLAQIATGAVVRHTSHGLLIHISLAAIVAVIAVAASVRLWGFYSENRHLRSGGLILIALISPQLLFGLLALLAIGLERSNAASPHPVDVIVTTIHQGVGALILTASVMCMLWTNRFLQSE